MRRFIAVVALMAVAIAAEAQPYVGAGVSTMKVEGGRAQSFVQPAIGYSLGALSVEAAYLNPGEVRESNSSASSANFLSTATASEHWKLKGARVSALYSLKVSGAASLVGRLSAYRLDGEYSASATATSFTPAGVVSSSSGSSQSGSGWVGGAGVGASYDVGKEFQGRMMFERVGSKAGMFGPGQDLGASSVLTLEAAYRF